MTTPGNLDWRTSGEHLWDEAQSLNLTLIRRSSINGRVLQFELTGFIDQDALGAEIDLEDFSARLLREFWSRPLDHLTGGDDADEWKEGR